jgi:ubiquinone/menaquinone biosynthesis C-methylase UbiE
MAGWFRKGLSPHHTALAMIGAKPGDRVLMLGAADPGLAAEVALVTGLNGSTTVCDPVATARANVEAAARDAGALVEFEDAPLTALPAADGSFDVAVLLGTAPPAGTHASAVCVEAMRVLRPGGRLIVIEGTKAGGFFRAKPSVPRRPAPEILALLDEIGTRARRELADVDGVAYYEGRKSSE